MHPAAIGRSRTRTAASSQNPPLNYYGELIRRQWQGCLPTIYQQIRDPGPYTPAYAGIPVQVNRGAAETHAVWLAGRQA